MKMSCSKNSAPVVSEIEPVFVWIQAWGMKPVRLSKMFGKGMGKMTEDEVVCVLHNYFDSLFPKVCPSCGRIFGTLLEYIQVTIPVGMPISYDANENNWNTTQPIGAVVHANCPCGPTLALTTEYMLLPKRLELFVRYENAASLFLKDLT